MFRHRRQLRTLAALMLFALAGCGGSTDDVAADTASLAYVESSGETGPKLASVEVATTNLAGATAETGPVVADRPAGEIEMSAELLRSMLESEPGRQLVVDGLVDQAGIVAEQAECFLDRVSVETMVLLSTATSVEDVAALPPESVAELQGVLAGCRIDPATMLG